MSEARQMLNLAARLALRGAGYVEPNPMVGAVIVREGVIIGMGHHRRFGGLHAEREALADCRARGNDPRSATIYVTLEPCRHFGKQPPCTDALIEAGLARVVFAREDPGEASGGGAAVLMQRGIQCQLSGACGLATGISDPFVRRAKTGLPWVTVKWAQTVQGRIATQAGENRWISNELSRRRVHLMRARVDAVLTGIGTVLADDPMLTARDVFVRRVARRVVVDTHLRLPLESALVRTAGQVPTIVACSAAHIAGAGAKARDELHRAGVTVIGVSERQTAGGPGVDLRELFLILMRDHGVATALVEGGPTLISSLFEADLVDEAIVYVAPLAVEEEQTRLAALARTAPRLVDGKQFTIWRQSQLVDDAELVYRRATRS
jgi:diaminohydroxyphosphoribosylaminopyrimidine deaminase / 5-amino-6-(5-phosphoribosylamino)uracil reductase